MSRLKTLTFIYMSFWSIVIGAVIGLYLQTINWLIDFVWKVLPKVLHIPYHWTTWCILLPMGIIIGVSQHYVGQYPLTIGEVLGEVKMKGHFTYHRWMRIVFNGLLILGAGGSIGPEASASGIAAGMIYWLGCRYKLVMSQQANLASLSTWRQIRIITTARIKNHQEQVDSHPITNYFDRPKTKKSAYTVWTLFGILGMLAFFKLFPQEGVIGIHTPTIHWQWQGLLVIIPAMIAGWLFGWLFVKIGQLSQKYLNDTLHPIVNGFLGGLMLAIAAMFSRDILFSGEFSIQGFAQKCLSMSPMFLLLFALIKATVTNAGFSLGWRGGTIFPAIFSSLSVGALAAHYLAWMPRLTVAITVTTSITIILERPLLTAVLLWLLLPIQFAPIILVVAYLTNYLNQKMHHKKA